MVDLMVIGAGPGGYEAAAYAAKLGKKVLLFEKSALGGTCLNIGCIPTKTLLRSARALEECRSASRYGVTGGDAFSLDLAAVQARKRNVISMLVKGVTGMLKCSGVEVVMEEARVTGPQTVEAGGRVYEGRNILIATGSVPACPPIPGLQGNPSVVDSTGILELESIPGELVVIGGGVIGLEFASFFAAVGTRVTVVEMMPRIAPPVDEEIVKRLTSELKRAGIVFNLSCKVLKLEGGTVTFLDGKGEERTVSGDLILSAIGRSPVCRGLGLEELGVTMDRRGIETDEKGRTSVPGIWACGDCTGRCLLAHAATREGIVAVRNMFGLEDSMSYGAIPSVIYTHPEVAQVGATESELKDARIPYRRIVMPMAVAGRFLVENDGKSGTVKVLLSANDGKILGVHMIGGCCGEFIASAAAMIQKGQSVEDVREIVFPHPTTSEALRETILMG